ncbi:MAG TPA: bile acid:sodium symporter family protein [Draconibacterium sp.]|jgi:bile acid:Na+ symporter, BASS family|nr:bile acid:sodium symporter family protein [Draconibacterium sp.]
MESSLLNVVLLPLALGVIMLGLGLSLTIDDFKRVVQYPKAILIGLISQMIILPVICFFIVRLFGLSPELAVGLMLLAASPGGPTANLYSHLYKGDVALNISLTAVNSLISLFTLPFIVNFAIDYFLNSGQVIPMQFKKVIEVFAIVLIPVSFGMLLKAKFPALSVKLNKPVKVLSALFLVLIIAGVVYQERENILSYFQMVGTAALVFNILSMAVGYYLPKLLKTGEKQAIAIGMEIGIHNGTLAIYIALSVIGNSMMSVPPAIYSLIMFFTAAAFGFLVNKKRK